MVPALTVSMAAEPFGLAVRGLAIPEHDQIDLAYNASDQVSSVVYKAGGAIVATLTISYGANGKVSSVVKS
jgi:hypothetical protein